MRNIAAAGLAASLALGACQTLEERPKESVGTLAGAAMGGLVGANIGGGSGRAVATGAGVLIGGVLGNQIGRSLDRADRLQIQATTERALETARTGEPVPWRNPETGNSGTVTATRTVENADGTACREYRQTIDVGGSVQEGQGLACRQPDGAWRIVR
jgi:surface antigen